MESDHYCGEFGSVGGVTKRSLCFGTGFFLFNLWTLFCYSNLGGISYSIISLNPENQLRVFRDKRTWEYVIGITALWHRYR